MSCWSSGWKWDGPKAAPSQTLLGKVANGRRRLLGAAHKRDFLTHRLAGREAGLRKIEDLERFQRCNRPVIGIDHEGIASRAEARRNKLHLARVRHVDVGTG